MNLKANISFLFVAVLLAIWGCKQVSRVIFIKPLSPYVNYAFLNTSDSLKTTQNKLYFFTLEVNRYKENELVDTLFSFIINKYKDDFDTLRPSLHFTFYKYQKGKVDENFKNDFNTELNNLYLVGTPLLSFQWNENNFLYVKKYNKDGKITLLGKKGEKINSDGEIELKEIK